MAIQRNHLLYSLQAMRQLAKEPGCLLKPPKTNTDIQVQKSTTESDSGGA